MKKQPTVKLKADRFLRILPRPRTLRSRQVSTILREDEWVLADVARIAGIKLNQVTQLPVSSAAFAPRLSLNNQTKSRFD